MTTSNKDYNSAEPTTVVAFRLTIKPSPAFIVIRRTAVGKEED